MARHGDAMEAELKAAGGVSLGVSRTRRGPVARTPRLLPAMRRGGSGLLRFEGGKPAGGGGVERVCAREHTPCRAPMPPHRDPPPPSPPLPLPQTTIMAVTYDGGVVLGADSRTSTGTYVANRATDKVTRVAESVFLCRSGSAADTQALAAAAATHLAALGVELGREPTVGAAARVLSRMAYANKDALQAGMIVAGVDASPDGAAGVVYALPLGGTLLSVPYAVGGSGSAYITGLCDKHWRPGMDRDAAVAFVRRAVAAAMARDGSSGGCIRTVAVDARRGVERGFVPGDAVAPSFGDLPLPTAVTVAATS